MSVGRQYEKGEAAAVPPIDIGALYEAHHVRLRRHAQARLPSSFHHEVDVALMTVFARLVQARAEDRLPEPRSWEAFLVAAVTRACQDLIKTARNNDEIDDNDPRTHRDAETDPTGETAVHLVEHADRVVRASAALETLDDRSRLIVIGKDGYERTNRDIGVELGLSGQRVGQLYDQALKQLREEVDRNS
ncbi:sigma-70 family RNA polymerase sigma factor [Rhodococcus opacus]|uniref:sigma-70 family RNA polymerase sigma factor n=1 Tax=Rhodococcus opacus TaxID=37919 RepID=UPI0013901480|nr:sigma-70 family RNA polymerase sigma factor [Rhodococcus opacus]MDX5970207.1 sigma-70 family RNA polymerase sigma factor [Rhodococcus opacus]NKY75126.1 sigma-70 family RNA polymerase sigma factor [Rhodococcus opacus]